ncbi:hypothetical protein KM043_006196 [Ampulex compressa]|nr:hypothetical protein KM043_006196 [Ampulex compressa]
MCEKPLRNSKGADKPFRSPFAYAGASQGKIKYDANIAPIARLPQYRVRNKFNSPIGISSSQNTLVKNNSGTPVAPSTIFIADNNKSTPVDIALANKCNDGTGTSVGALEIGKEQGDAFTTISDNINQDSKPPVSKRLIFQDAPSPKRQCIRNESQENKADQEHVALLQNDLKALKRRIYDKRRLVEDVKRRLLYCKKHKAEDLKAAIEKWTSVCQTILLDYQKDTEERCGEPVRMEQILTAFGIDPNLVCFSIEEEMFV